MLRERPRHFVGIHPTREAAEAKAREMGAGYVVKFGENREGTDDFVWSGDSDAKGA